MLRLKHSATATALLIGLAISGCTTQVGEFSEKSKKHSQELQEWKRVMNAPREDRVRITNMPVAGERIALERNRWLKEKRITITMDKAGSGVSARALAQMLKDKGIQVMSSLPLEGYQYNGFGVTNVDGETALRMLFGPMGLDYDINDASQYVVITPNKAKTYYIKLGERKTEYQSGTMSGNIGGGGGGGGGESTGASGAGGESGGSVGGVSTGLDTGSGRVTVEGDFWANIERELAALLTQCVPTRTAPPVNATSSLPPFPPEMGGGGDGSPFNNPALMQQQMAFQMAPQAAVGETSANLCVDQKVGQFAVNATTGAITVQAPHWVMQQIGAYLDNVKADNSVTMIYEGMLISVTSSREKSEGIDLQGFASFASDSLGMVVSNNALGGVTVTPGTIGGSGGAGSPAVVVPGGSTVASSFIGLQKLTGNPAQAFLAYLEANAEFSVKQKPRVAVTNGIPGEFGQYDTLFYNQLSQQSSSGDSGSAQVGTTNQLIPFKVGSLLRIIPYYDHESGSVRSPITFTQSVQTGNFETVQFITGADGNVQQVPSSIPLIRDSNYSGEVLMRDGDMLIIGGQVSESSESSGSGLPGYNAENNFLSGFMGQKKHKDQINTYYLALTLKVNK